MIIVQLLGGLGNQLFQYAAARRLAEAKGTELKLDLSAFESYKLREYKLDRFNIAASIATTEEISRFTRPTLRARLIKRLEKKLLPYYLQSDLIEKRRYHFDPNFLRSRKTVYLKGYFQSPRYFLEIESLIRQEFCVKDVPDNLNKELGALIGNVNAVSLHVRRGDYATNPVARSYHGLLTISYYHSAIKIIAEKVVQPHFFVFSDDVAWVRDHLEIPSPVTFVEHNDAAHDYEDLRLMALCKHHIIANSSFSWWGAWLSSNSAKMVFAPARWVLDSSIDASELLPSNWYRVPITGD